MLAPATLAALPSTRAIPDRHVFYVADPVSSIDQSLGIKRLLSAMAVSLLLRLVYLISELLLRVNLIMKAGTQEMFCRYLSCVRAFIGYLRKLPHPFT